MSLPRGTHIYAPVTLAKDQIQWIIPTTFDYQNVDGYLQRLVQELAEYFERRA